MMVKTTLEWWSGWSDIFGVTAAILAGILGLVTLLGWGFSWKAGKLKDVALEKYKVEAKRSIADADAKAAEANNAAANANQRAAEADLEAQRLKKQLAWREVTPTQATVLHEALKDSSMQITISWVAGDPEGSQFAQRLGKVFVDAGVTLAAFAPMGHLGEEPHGLSVSGSEHQEVQLLSEALDKAGFGPVGVKVSARKPDGTNFVTHLEVGYRPAPVLDVRSP